MTDKEKQEIAEKIGKAYGRGHRIGELVAKRILEFVAMIEKGEVADAAEWVTVHPNGPQSPGQHCLIDKVANLFLAGLGGKFTGMSLGRAFKNAIGRILKRKGKSKNQPKENNPQENSPNTQPSQQPPKKPEDKNKSENKVATPSNFSLETATKVDDKTPIPEGYKYIKRLENGSVELNSRIADFYHKNTAFKGSGKKGNQKNELKETPTFNALRAYTHEGDKEMNGLLRSGIGPNSGAGDPNIVSQIKAIDAYMDKHRTKGPMMLLRGLRNPDKGRETINSGRYEDLGYTSTTTDALKARRFTKMDSEGNSYVVVLNVPKGYGAVSLEKKGLTKYPGENEILLQRGIKGDVKNVQFRKDPKSGKKVYHIYVEVERNN